MSQKDSVLEAIRRLPDDIDFEDAIEEIRILKQLDEAELDIQQGRVTPHADVRKLIRTWIGQ